MAIIDKASVPVRTGSIYPEPYASQMAGRSSQRLGDAGGLTQFGANEVILQPGAQSSLRHWHHREDEFVMVLRGECTLVQDEGETVLRPGDCAAFPAGDPNGHHFVNKTGAEARFLVIGARMNPETAIYCDVDLQVELKDGKATFTHKDGTPYQEERT
ncbi:MAG: cupin domain-containing protein [Rhodobacteraceae bacterium]|nr:cupin domain-containing protein [Paracoccaceae bacterium]MCP5342936.1 cupin domain-containing protein [Paracoccaceae bacterium]